MDRVFLTPRLAVCEHKVISMPEGMNSIVFFTVCSIIMLSECYFHKS